MATQTWLWVFFFLQGRLPCNLASWGFQPPHPRPGAFLHEKGPGPKSVFKGGRTTRGTVEVRPPLKSPLCRGWLPRKIDSLQPREGIRVSGKISCLRRGEPLREIFRAYPLWRTDRGTGVSPANFSPIFFRQKMGPGAGRSACKATARWNLDKALLAGGSKGRHEGPYNKVMDAVLLPHFLPDTVRETSVPAGALTTQVSSLTNSSWWNALALPYL